MVEHLYASYVRCFQKQLLWLMHKLKNTGAVVHIRNHRLPPPAAGSESPVGAAGFCSYKPLGITNILVCRGISDAVICLL